jgi:hypothetical protein
MEPPVVLPSRPASLDAARAKLGLAIKGFEEGYAAYMATTKSRTLPIPSLTLQQLLTCFNAEDQDSPDGNGKLGENVKGLLLANLEKESLLHPVKKDIPMMESAKKTLGAVGDFMTKMLPLAIVGCKVVGVVGEAHLVAAPLKSIGNGAVLLLQLAQAEKERGQEVIVELERISYQSRRVSVMQKYPAGKLSPLLREKSLALLTEVINFFTATLKYWKHGFFRNLGRNLLLGPEVWQAGVAALHLAYEEYDQSLLLQIADTMMGRTLSHHQLVI